MSNFPQYDRSNQLSPGVIPEGFFDVALERMEHRVAKSSGADMIVARFIVDNGEAQGAQIENMYVFGSAKGFGEKTLQGFANAARKADGSLEPQGDNPGGFVFHANHPSWDAYAAQFLTNPPLRVNIEVRHSYDVEKPDGDWARDVKKADYEAAKAAGQRVSVKASILPWSYRPPVAAPVLRVVAQGEQKAPAMPSYPGTAAPAAHTNGVVPAGF